MTSNMQIFLNLLLTIALAFGKLVRVDLTHDYSENTTAFWEMKNAFRFTSKVNVSLPTYIYKANTFCTAEHGGTHIDAPIHFAAGKHSVEEIPLERLIARPFIIDVSDESNQNSDYQLDVARIEKAEKEQGTIPDGSMLLIYTGFSLKWNNLTEYFGGNPTNSKEYHFPGISPAASQWLVDNRKIASVGLDTASVDYGQSTKFETHVILYTNNIPGFENVDLSKIKSLVGKKDLLIIGLPIKIKGGTGAPSRIVATYDDDDKSSAVMTLTPITLISLAALFSMIMMYQ